MQRGFSLMLLVFFVAILAIVGAGSFFFFNKQQLSAIDSFEECAKKYPIMESYPAQCRTPDGKHFVEELSDEERQKVVPPEASSSVVIDEMANWGIYVNSKVGFRIKYPNASKLPYYIEGIRGGQPVNVTGLENNEFINFPGNNAQYDSDYSLDLFPFQGTLEEVFASDNKKFGMNGYSERQKIDKDFLIGGQPSIWYYYPEQKQFEVGFVAKKYGFIFISVVDMSEQKMERILTSFRFL